MAPKTNFPEAMQERKPILLTPNETAKTGIMSAYAIRKGIKDGTVPYVKIGAHYRVNYSKLLQQLNDC